MATELKDLNEIREIIQLYIDGSNGDVEKLTKAFHPNARMFGHIGDNPYGSGPITEFISWIGENPGNAGPNYEAIIRTIDISGDAGVAVLVETDYMGHDFVDYFSVARIDGEWKITNKTYAETGVTSPAS